MADNSSLSAARSAKNDEFYTQYSDIEAEMNAYVEYNPRRVQGQDGSVAVRRPGMVELH